VRAIIAGGGTGGHLFPALALAQKLRQRSVDVFLVGAGSASERAILRCEAISFRTIKIRGFKGKSLGGRFATLASLPQALIQSWAILREVKPHVVVGMGGYASGPILLMAALLRFPTIIHEQNAFPGLSNRILGPLVDVVALSFPESVPFIRGKRRAVTGNPIREALFGADRIKARENFGLQSHRLTILIFGGSQGARRINLAMLEALPHLQRFRERVQFLHAAGEQDLPLVKRAYEEAGWVAEVRPFFQEMAEAYASADLCLCRSGASTVAELCALGKPALLIPYPYAANDHQRLNALALVRIGGARMLLDGELSGKAIAAFLEEVLAKPSLLEEMGRSAKELGRPDAASRLADFVCELAKGKS